MPARIPGVCWAEPAVTRFALLGGMNHARLIPERNALAEYRGRLSFLFTHGDACPVAKRVLPAVNLTTTRSFVYFAFRNPAEAQERLCLFPVPQTAGPIVGTHTAKRPSIALGSMPS